MTTHQPPAPHLADTRAAAFKAWINSDRAFLDTGHTLDYADFPRTAGGVGALVGHLNRVCGGDEPRRLLLHYCFGVDSSRDLHVRQRNALYAWLAPRCFEYAELIPTDYETPDLDGDPDKEVWLVRRQCAVTAALVVLAARAALGQMAMPVSWTVNVKETA